MGLNGPSVTCNKCGWVSFAVSLEYAKNEVKRFNEYFDSLTKEEQDLYYGGRTSSLSNYTCMVCCGISFRPWKVGDSPDGCTINPVIVDDPSSF